MKNHGIIFDIKKFSLHDGPGIRTTVFFKGCPLNCWWCHNPESQNNDIEYMNKPRLVTEKVLVGRKILIEEIMKEIEKDIIFFDQSNGGVTFSGGEPLLQYEFLFSLLKKCKNLDLKTVVDTTGYCDYDKLKSISDITDILLYDLKIINNDEHKKYTGVSNTLILENLQKISLKRKNTRIRIPLICGITDTYENILGIIKLISPLHNIDRIDILPYIKAGIEKYRRLERNYRLKERMSPTDERVEEIKNMFEESGYIVKVGG